ncbi:helix-turn-helix domain-containing protein [Catelliglobosispora koreensis]|uniref:helix-turn-helix domain-containing protein n=1 Tax=Catelliglobosispora koreensis TaxID=129052 RepID=UPI000374A6D8|nr:helix-turn-helix transcriptional regulator [Catelliglobosispora koreensis]
MPDQSSLGHRLARLRRRRGLSQQQLADRLCAAAGTATISRNEISRWERGVRVPSGAWLTLLSQVLGAALGPPGP